jgi:hypothetical protein
VEWVLVVAEVRSTPEVEVGADTQKPGLAVVGLILADAHRADGMTRPEVLHP